MCSHTHKLNQEQVQGRSFPVVLSRERALSLNLRRICFFVYFFVIYVASAANLPQREIFWADQTTKTVVFSAIAEN